MISFLNASMGSATSRFITFEQGRGNFERVKETFSSAVIVHIGIAISVLIFLETVGLWFLETELVIPECRMNAARIVFQLSIFGTVVGITQSPYDAVLISHEKFDVYAYLGILNIVLRLIIVFALQIISCDKLILYAILQLAVSVVMICLYRGYCLAKFKESHFSFIWKPEILKPMLSFSGLDLFGNASVMVRTQGVGVLLNMFFGPLMNAASGIAGTVQNAVMSMAGNVVTAVRPQIVKRYASGEYDSMFELLGYAIKLCFILLALFTIPLLCETNYILRLWLKNVPENTIVLCNLTLLFNFFANASLLLAVVIHATGRIKRISLINGSMYILVLPFSYFAFKLGCEAWTAYLFNVLAVLIGLTSNAWTIRLYLPTFPFRRFMIRNILPNIMVVAVVYGVVQKITQFMNEGFFRLLLTTCASSVMLLIFSYFILFDQKERSQILSFIKRWACQKV